MDEDAENSIRTRFPAAFQNGQFVKLIDIEAEINDLINKNIMSEKAANVAIMERKGVNLYHPFMNRILEKHTISSINFGKLSHITFVKQITRTLPIIHKIKAILKINTKKTFLLTDAVDEGKEVREVIKHLAYENSELTKVCGYVCKKEGIEKLKKIYPAITFSFVHEANDDKEYWNEITRLIQLSQTRLEPLDRDHCFSIYKFKSGMTNDQMIGLFNNILTEKLGYEINFEEDFLVPLEEEIESATLEIENIPQFIESFQIPVSEIFDIYRVIFRIRFDKNRNLFRSFCYFEIEIDTNKLSDNEKFCSELVNKCCPDGKGKKIITSVCVQCVENNLSSIVLDGVNQVISQHPISKQYNMQVVSQYSPYYSF